MKRGFDGFRIDRREGVKGVSFRVQIWDPAGLAYATSKTFAARKLGNAREAERAAERWGREQVTALRATGTPLYRGAGGETKKILGMYIDDLVSRGANPTALANVRRRLESLSRFCPDLAADGAGRQVYEWWRAWCDEPAQIGHKSGVSVAKTTTGKPKSLRTKNNGLTDCKAFLHWAWNARALTELRRPVDCDWIKKHREESTVKPQFSVDELRRGLRAHADPFRVRWALYLYLGARSREVLQLRWDHFEGGHVLLSGKGRKQRLVPVQVELRTILRLYRRGGGDFEGYLFPPALRRADGGNLSKRFDAFLERCGIPKNGRSTHSLRHCYAGLMTATGEPTALLQAYMGHSQSDMTRHYAQMAARFRDFVDGWGRGKLRLLRGR